MKKRIIATIVLAFALTIIMTYCANNKGTNTATPESTQTSAPATAPKTSTTATEAPKTEKPTPTQVPESTEHSHSFGKWSIITEPTCEKEGAKERVCSCGEKEKVVLEITDHEFVDGTCTMCKKTDGTKFVPDYKPGQQNTVGSDMSMGTYCSQGNWIYFSPSAYEIAKITKIGTNKTTVYEVSAGNILNINVVGDWIYFYCEGNTEGKSYIAKVRTDGTGFEKLLSGVRIWNMLVIKDKLFYIAYKNQYSDYSMDCNPLYCISVNGGATKMIHDGAVESLMSDGTYLYFCHKTESDVTSICRVKHDSTAKSTLITFKKGEGTNYFTVRDSKIYFLKFDKYSEECTFASIATNGGSYTTYGKIPFYSDFLYAAGSKLYYYGAMYSAGGFPSEECGLVEYDTATKRYKMIKVDYENGMYYFTDGLIILEGFTGEALTKLTVYNAQNGSTMNFKIK